MLSEQTEKRVIEFVTMIARRCSTCLHRNWNCDRCDSRIAKSIQIDIEVDTHPTEAREIDYSFAARAVRIIHTLAKANRPLLSKQIPLDICSYQLKRWTLNKLVERGLLGRKRKYRKAGRTPHNKTYSYYYFLKPAGVQYNERHPFHGS